MTSRVPIIIRGWVKLAHLSIRRQPAHRPRRGRLPAPGPSIAALLILLVSAVLPATAPRRPGVVRAPVVALSAPAATVDREPASVTVVPKVRAAAPRRATGPARVSAASLESGSYTVPEVLLEAYRKAVAGAPPSCHLPLSLLAAIGQVESGSLAGRSIDAAHRAVPPVFGPVLDGVSFAAIRDSDGGRLDGNAAWDRAVGPMQFIPGTWATFGVDGDGNGQADPQNVYDATASAVGYLCAGGRDLALASGLQSAILSYNHSTAYLSSVLAAMRGFGGSGSGTEVANQLTAILARPNANPPGSDAARTTALGGQPATATAQPASGRTKTPGNIGARGTTLTTSAQPTPTGPTPTGPTPTGPTPTERTPTEPSSTESTSAEPSSTSTDGTGGTTVVEPPVVTAQDPGGNTSPGAPATVSVVSAAAQSSTVGQAFSGPLVVEVTDANANPVSGQTVTFSAPDGGASGLFANGTATATAVTDASGQATSGVVSASATAGTFGVTARAGSASASFTLTNTPGEAAKLGIVPTSLTGPVSDTANLGPITVQLQDRYGNGVPAPDGGIEVTFASDSAGTAVFAETVRGTMVTSLVIPAGKPSVTFYYGDTKVGTPLITVRGLLAGLTQSETIKVSAAVKLTVAPQP